MLCVCADVVLIAITDDISNSNFFGSELFSSGKLHSIVNISRPYIVDNECIVQALEHGRLACYYSDFHFDSDSPLVKTFAEQGRLLALPHMGGCTYASWRHSLDLICSFL